MAQKLNFASPTDERGVIENRKCGNYNVGFKECTVHFYWFDWSVFLDIRNISVFGMYCTSKVSSVNWVCYKLIKNNSKYDFTCKGLTITDELELVSLSVRFFLCYFYSKTQQFLSLADLKR